MAPDAATLARELTSLGEAAFKRRLTQGLPIEAGPLLSALRDEASCHYHANASEARHIRRVLKHTGGHRANSAKILGISRKNLWEKMRELEIRDDDE